MRIQAVNNYQTHNNQTNFEARTLKIGTHIISGESPSHTFVDEKNADRLGNINVLKIIGDTKHTSGGVIAHLYFKTTEALNKFIDKLAPAMHDAKYTDGSLIDLTKEYNDLYMK